jgi:hypothetical protein
MARNGLEYEEKKIGVDQVGKYIMSYLNVREEVEHGGFLFKMCRWGIIFEILSLALSLSSLIYYNKHK